METEDAAFAFLVQDDSTVANKACFSYTASQNILSDDEEAAVVSARAKPSFGARRVIVPRSVSPGRESDQAYLNTKISIVTEEESPHHIKESITRVTSSSSPPFNAPKRAAVSTTSPVDLRISEKNKNNNSCLAQFYHPHPPPLPGTPAEDLVTPALLLPDCLSRVFSLSSFNKIQAEVALGVASAAASTQSVLVVAPTGCGKTAISELAIALLFKNVLVGGSDTSLVEAGFTTGACAVARAGKAPDPLRPKALYLCPLRALANQQFEHWRTGLGTLLNLALDTGEGISCSFCSEEGMMDSLVILAASDIIISTPESWDSLSRRLAVASLDSSPEAAAISKIMASISLLVLDEVHSVGASSGRRGGTLEAVVSRVRALTAERLRIVALSATLPNPYDFAAWLHVPIADKDPQGTVPVIDINFSSPPGHSDYTCHSLSGIVGGAGVPASHGSSCVLLGSEENQLRFATPHRRGLLFAFGLRDRPVPLQLNVLGVDDFIFRKRIKDSDSSSFRINSFMFNRHLSRRLFSTIVAEHERLSRGVGGSSTNSDTVATLRPTLVFCSTRADCVASALQLAADVAAAITGQTDASSHPTAAVTARRKQVGGVGGGAGQAGSVACDIRNLDLRALEAEAKATTFTLPPSLSAEKDPNTSPPRITFFEFLRTYISDRRLATALLLGVGYHHGGMASGDRAAVEWLFKNNDSLVNNSNNNNNTASAQTDFSNTSQVLPSILMVVCTATLAVGVNLPCRLVVIKGTSGWPRAGSVALRDDADAVDDSLSASERFSMQSLSALDLVQLCGRAGRLGLDSVGAGVVMTSLSTAEQYRKLILLLGAGSADTLAAEPLESQLLFALPEQVAVEVSMTSVTDVPHSLFRGSAVSKSLTIAGLWAWITSTFMAARVGKKQEYYRDLLRIRECKFDSKDPSALLREAITLAIGLLVNEHCLRLGHEGDDPGHHTSCTVDSVVSDAPVRNDLGKMRTFITKPGRLLVQFHLPVSVLRQINIHFLKQIMAANNTPFSLSESNFSFFNTSLNNNNNNNINNKIDNSDALGCIVKNAQRQAMQVLESESFASENESQSNERRVRFLCTIKEQGTVHLRFFSSCCAFLKLTLSHVKAASHCKSSFQLALRFLLELVARCAASSLCEDGSLTLLRRLAASGPSGCLYDPSIDEDAGAGGSLRFRIGDKGILNQINSSKDIIFPIIKIPVSGQPRRSEPTLAPVSSVWHKVFILLQLRLRARGGACNSALTLLEKEHGLLACTAVLMDSLKSSGKGGGVAARIAKFVSEYILWVLAIQTAAGGRGGGGNQPRWSSYAPLLPIAVAVAKGLRWGLWYEALPLDDCPNALDSIRAVSSSTQTAPRSTFLSQLRSANDVLTGALADLQVNNNKSGSTPSGKSRSISGTAGRTLIATRKDESNLGLHNNNNNVSGSVYEIHSVLNRIVCIDDLVLYAAVLCVGGYHSIYKQLCRSGHPCIVLDIAVAASHLAVALGCGKDAEKGKVDQLERLITEAASCCVRFGFASDRENSMINLNVLRTRGLLESPWVKDLLYSNLLNKNRNSKKIKAGLEYENEVSGGGDHLDVYFFGSYTLHLRSRTCYVRQCDALQGDGKDSLTLLPTFLEKQQEVTVLVYTREAPHHVLVAKRVTPSRNDQTGQEFAIDLNFDIFISQNSLRTNRQVSTIFNDKGKSAAKHFNKTHPSTHSLCDNYDVNLPLWTDASRWRLNGNYSLNNHLGPKEEVMRAYLPFTNSSLTQIPAVAVFPLQSPLRSDASLALTALSHGGLGCNFEKVKNDTAEPLREHIDDSMLYLDLVVCILNDSLLGCDDEYVVNVPVAVLEVGDEELPLPYKINSTAGADADAMRRTRASQAQTKRKKKKELISREVPQLECVKNTGINSRADVQVQHIKDTNNNNSNSTNNTLDKIYEKLQFKKEPRSTFSTSVINNNNISTDKFEPTPPPSAAVVAMPTESAIAVPCNASLVSCPPQSETLSASNSLTKTAVLPQMPAGGAVDPTTFADPAVQVKMMELCKSFMNFMATQMPRQECGGTGGCASDATCSLNKTQEGGCPAASVPSLTADRLKAVSGDENRINQSTEVGLESSLASPTNSVVCRDAIVARTERKNETTKNQADLSALNDSKTLRRNVETSGGCTSAIPTPTSTEGAKDPRSRLFVVVDETGTAAEERIGCAVRLPLSPAPADPGGVPESTGGCRTSCPPEGSPATSFSELMHECLPPELTPPAAPQVAGAAVRCRPLAPLASAPQNHAISNNTTTATPQWHSTGGVRSQYSSTVPSSGPGVVNSALSRIDAMKSLIASSKSSGLMGRNGGCGGAQPEFNYRNNRLATGGGYSAFSFQPNSVLQAAPQQDSFYENFTQEGVPRQMATAPGGGHYAHLSYPQQQTGFGGWQWGGRGRAEYDGQHRGQQQNVSQRRTEALNYSQGQTQQGAYPMWWQ